MFFRITFKKPLETSLNRLTTNDDKLVLISLIPQNAALHPSLIPDYSKSINYKMEHKTDIVLNLTKRIFN